MKLNWKDPKVLIGGAVGLLALWYFFLRTPSSQQVAQKTSATTPSDQGTAPGFPSGGDSGQGAGSGGSSGGVDLSGIIDSILSSSTANHAYDLSFLSGLQQSDLSYLGGFSSSFLGYSADVNQEFAGLASDALNANTGLISQLLASTQAGAIPQGSAGGGVVIPTGAAATQRVRSSTNEPLVFAQPRGTFPTPQSSPRATAALSSIPGIGAAVGIASGASRPVFPVVHSAPVVPAVHERGGVHGPAMD